MDINIVFGDLNSLTARLMVKFQFDSYVLLY